MAGYVNGIDHPDHETGVQPVPDVPGPRRTMLQLKQLLPHLILHRQPPETVRDLLGIVLPDAMIFGPDAINDAITA